MAPRPPLHELPDELVARYRADGAVPVRGVFDASWIERLRAGVEKVLAAPGPLVRVNTAEGDPGLFFVDFCMWRRFDEFRAFALESPAAELAARLMGARRVRFYHDHLLVKEPGTRDRTLWHHDLPYWPLEGEHVLSLWLPLDPVPREVCPEFVRGSHRWGRRFAPRRFRDASGLAASDDGYEPMPDLDAERERHEMLAWQLEPGDAIAFHALVVHGAPGNPATDRRRRGYATRWLGDDVRWAERAGAVSPPIEGHGLRPGDPVESEVFPLVWPRG